MANEGNRTSQYVLLFLVLAGVVAALLYWRPQVLAWYHLRGLVQADDHNRDASVRMVVQLQSPPITGLLDLLTSQDSRVCQNAKAVLDGLWQRWKRNDVRIHELTSHLIDRFPTMSTNGQVVALQWYLNVVQEDAQKALSQKLEEQACRFVYAATQSSEKEVSRFTTNLARLLLDKSARPDRLSNCRTFILSRLRDRDQDLRVQGLDLALHPIFTQDQDLLREIVPLLKDPSPAVRLRALLAVGSARKVIRNDDLVFMLHDSDPEIRNLCRTALQSRGLTENQIVLRHLITDENAFNRLKILDRLAASEDVNTEQWLYRLSLDPADAVRVGAIRLASQYSSRKLRDRMADMVESDPAPTVRELAAHYLRQAQSSQIQER